MSNQILTLNASNEPLQMLPYKDAMRLIVTGKAELVEGDPDRLVRSEQMSMPRPHVIRLVKYVNLPRRLLRKVTNTFLFARDGYRCQYCGKHENDLKGRNVLEREHVIPTSKGGADAWTNVVTACSSCNARKADKTPEQAGMTLRSKPAVPNLVRLRWEVRRLTPLQRKWIELFFGKATADAFADQ